MKNLSLLIPVVTLLTLTACQEQPGSQTEPDPDRVGEPQPRSEVSVPPELLPEEQTADPNVPRKDKTMSIQKPARFDSIKITRTEDGPALLLKGHLPDGATKLLPAKRDTRAGVLYIEINTERDPEAMGTMALVPFERVIPLPDPPPAQIIVNDRPVVTGAE